STHLPVRRQRQMCIRDSPDPQAMAARRGDHLRAALQLRPDQEPALKAFLAASQPAARPAPGDRAAMAGMTTPQRLDAQRARMTERLARFDQRAAATKKFYAQLSPAQQKAFDTLAPRGPGKGMGGRHGGHGPQGG
ncbi:Spy/CpxP family protein refolding chaperone, partial [Phenylobacterium sp. 58.2.17]|uniref:Spy/CpxP family protein refolding chaperone n=1 Tax=Phenylobacterium sp. 58.2.17 TaxID=2969306 RepID=UPI002263CCD0